MINQNRLELFKLVAKFKLDSCHVVSAIEQGKDDFVEFMLSGEVKLWFTVPMAQECLKKCKNDRITMLLQRWITKQLGIPSVKVEGIGIL
jgi:hypothetical protein